MVKGIDTAARFYDHSRDWGELDEPNTIRVRQTLALLPDHPPRYFLWKGVRHNVRRADGPERVFGEWWKRDREKAAVREAVVERRMPYFGVCLGHQSIASAFGGKIIKAKKLMHGKTSMVKHDNKNLFNGLPNPFQATRYHSLVLDKNTVPDEFEITATSDDGEIMGIRHKTKFIEGVQFHPESILTISGKDLLKNFLKMPTN